LPNLEPQSNLRIRSFGTRSGLADQRNHRSSHTDAYGNANTYAYGLAYAYAHTDTVHGKMCTNAEAASDSGASVDTAPESRARHVGDIVPAGSILGRLRKLRRADSALPHANY
jgi:hypothetical protein